MKLLRAAHLGMCFGVRDAIDLAQRLADRESLTILGELVHNETVLDALRRRGIRIAQDVAAVTTATALVTAHGASERAQARARARGLRVVEATCPLVRRAHEAVAQLVREGYHPVIIGLRQHVEVRGITEDLNAYEVVLTEADVRQLAPRPRWGVIAQTTQPLDRVRHLVAMIQARFPEAEVRYVDTVCRPTKERQAAAMALARRAEVVVVVGGSRSNNTRELAATCRRHGARVYQVQSAAELNPDWFLGVETVGLTAGTSTPDAVIDEVERWLRERAEANASPVEAELVF